MASRTIRVRMVALLLVPPAIGMTVGALRASALLAPAIQQAADAPDHWVALSADVTITKPGGSPVVGRFFRASDGSRRLETGPAPNNVQVVSILNASEGQEYVYSPGTGWFVRTVAGMTPGDYRPRVLLSNRPDLSAYPYRLALRQGESGSLTAATGFRAYQQTAPDGTTKLIVPELNFLEAVMRSPNGRTESYTNIVLAEPPSAVFHPPAGVVVKRQTPRDPGAH